MRFNYCSLTFASLLVSALDLVASAPLGRGSIFDDDYPRDHSGRIVSKGRSSIFDDDYPRDYSGRIVSKGRSSIFDDDYPRDYSGRIVSGSRKYSSDCSDDHPNVGRHVFEKKPRDPLDDIIENPYVRPYKIEDDYDELYGDDDDLSYDDYYEFYDKYVPEDKQVGRLVFGKKPSASRGSHAAKKSESCESDKSERRGKPDQENQVGRLVFGRNPAHHGEDGEVFDDGYDDAYPEDNQVGHLAFGKNPSNSRDESPYVRPYNIEDVYDELYGDDDDLSYDEYYDFYDNYVPEDKQVGRSVRGGRAPEPYIPYNYREYDDDEVYEVGQPRKKVERLPKRFFKILMT